MAQTALERHIPADRLLITRLRLAWPTLVPPALVSRTWPYGLERGQTLVIAVQDNQWLHELTYLRADLLDRIRQHVGQGVDNLRFRLGEMPAAVEDPPERVSPPRMQPMNAEPSPATLDALERIHDGSLRHAIASARVALSRP